MNSRTFRLNPNENGASWYQTNTSTVNTRWQQYNQSSPPSPVLSHQRSVFTSNIQSRNVSNGAQQPLSPKLSFQNQLLAVQNWFNNLIEEEARESLYAVLETFPYPWMVEEVMKSFYVQGSEIDNLRFEKLSMSPLSYPKIGVIGQERPHSTSLFDYAGMVRAQENSPTTCIDPRLKQPLNMRPKSVELSDISVGPNGWTSNNSPFSKYNNSNLGNQDHTARAAHLSNSNAQTPLWLNNPDDYRFVNNAINCNNGTTHSNICNNTSSSRNSPVLSGSDRLRHPIPQRRTHSETRHKSTFTPPPSSNSPKEKGRIPDEINFELLQDVPAWLKSLRLHKYTHIFDPDVPPSASDETQSGSSNSPVTTNPVNSNSHGTGGKKWTWNEMIELTDEELEAMGVKALGARRKMLKVFDMVKKSQEATVQLQESLN